MQKKNKVIPITKDVSVTNKEVVGTMKKLHRYAEAVQCRYALIGGALFRLLGIDYDTQDIDVAADQILAWDGPFFTTKGKNSTPGAGHYLVDGTPVEWMTHGRPGSELLFEAAVERSYLHDSGVWIAPLEYAMAIKIYAGREKDKELFRELWDTDVINGQLILDIVKHYTGEEPEI